jgi:hypothetical protein
MAFLQYRPTQTLHQYTSVAGFLGIIDSKQLWFSDLASTNDPRELKIGYQHFIEALRSVRAAEYKGDVGSFLTFLGRQTDRFHEVQQAFCACFSALKDELPMWREYGAEGEGLCIGFRPTALFALPARFQKVRYVDPRVADDFRTLVLDLASQLDRAKDFDDLVYWVDATVSVMARVTSLKHASWAYETEVRLVYVQTKIPPDQHDQKIFSQTSLMPDDSPVYWTRPSERVGPSGTTAYLAFPFGRFRNGRCDPGRAISDVVIGPKCKLSANEIIEVMHAGGFMDFTVYKSECEIR